MTALTNPAGVVWPTRSGILPRRARVVDSEVMRAPPSLLGRLRFAGLVVFAATVVGGPPARASDPSGACKEGAALCKEAFERLQSCESKNPTTPDACVGERAEADNACKTTTSACHTDGSREPPAALPGNAPKR